MQKITLIGNIGRDAQVKEASNGRKFVTFSVAVNGFKNKEVKTSWYSITWFNYLPNMLQYLVKGSSVVVGGELDADLRVDNNTGATFIDRNVLADYVNFNSNKTDNNKSEGANNSTQQTSNTSSVQAPSDEEITTMSKRTQEPKQQVIETSVEESDLPF